MAADSTLIPLFKVHMAPPELLMPALQRTLYSGQLAEGPRVREFEAQLIDFLGRPVLATSSGTAALHLALILAGVQPGDEVISTPMTAEPTNLAILYTGAKIVWADVDPRNGNLDPLSVAARIGARTKAIMAVHYGGVPVDLHALRIAADGLPIIEDAAHALGARYAGYPIGSRGEFVVFSFQAIKHLTTGDGGALALDALQIERCRRLRWFGIDRASERTAVNVAEVGYKYNMNDLTATLGLVQWHDRIEVLEAHQANGRYFDRALQGVAGLELCTYPDMAGPAYWFYTILAERRDDLVHKLVSFGIGCGTAHRRNDEHTIFAPFRCDLPGVDAFAAKVLHIPCGWWVGEAERERIVTCLQEGW